MFIIDNVVNGSTNIMNKKLITLFTALSISTLAISGALLFKTHQDGLKKVAATNKTVALTSIEDLYVLDIDNEFGAEGDISTGPETYIHTYIDGKHCYYQEDNTKFLSVTNTTDWLGEVTIALDVRGLVSYEVRGTITDPSGYNSYYSEFIPYSLIDGADELEDETGPVSFTWNESHNVNTKDHTERIKFHFTTVGTVSITSIILTMSCERN